MEDELKARFRRSRSRKRIIAIAVLFAVVILALLVYMKVRESKMLTYDTETLDRGEIAAVVSATGSLSPVTTVDVGSQVSGTIQQIFVDYNDRVREGQILARIDPSLYETQLAQAKARLESAKSSLDSARADLDKANIAVDQARAEIYRARAGVDQAKADKEAARSELVSAQAAEQKAKAQMQNDYNEYRRAAGLYDENLIAASEKEKAYTVWQVSKATYESAKAGVESARAALVAAKSKVDSATANLKAAMTQKSSAEAAVRAAAAKITASEAAIRQNEGDVASVKVNLDRCIIRSSINGIVIDRKVEPGQTVAASFQTPVLFQLARNLEMMEVDASVDEADIGNVRVGQKAAFTVDAFPEDRFSGKICQVRSSPKTEQNVVTYDVIIRTENRNLKLKPGMTANIEITTIVKKDILRIPNVALRFRPEKVPNFPYSDEVKKEMEEKGKFHEGAERNKGSMAGRSPEAQSVRGKGSPGDLVCVWVLENGRPRRFMIRPGISDNSYTEMKSGDLVAGMEVITDATVGKRKTEKDKGKRRRTLRIGR